MKRFLQYALCIIAVVAAVTACGDDTTDVNDINQQTVLVYMPWSGSSTDSGLYRYFQNNLDSIRKAIRADKGLNGRAMVFISTSSRTSVLYEMKYENDSIINDTLKTYSGHDYTTAAGITQILNDVQSCAYALNYALIVGSHGLGWIYKDDWLSTPAAAQLRTMQTAGSLGKNATAKTSATSFDSPLIRPASDMKPPYPATRFFGSASDIADYATDITTLAEGIAAAGIKMQYILFDDCYMANIETAYELRGVTNFLIASTSEVLATGMPYQTMWKELAKQAPDYDAAVSDFYDFYSNFKSPYGALSAIDCRQVEGLASIMKEINTNYTFSSDSLSKIQVLDGYHTPIFYDMGDYVDHFCTNTDLLSDFHARLSDVVRATAHTDQLYSYLYYSPVYIDVKTYSGITISDPSLNDAAKKGMKKTAWWAATHP